MAKVLCFKCRKSHFNQPCPPDESSAMQAVTQFGNQLRTNGVPVKLTEENNLLIDRWELLAAMSQG